MAAVVLYGSDGARINMGDNHWLMLIHQVTLVRFRENEGFYLTVVGKSDDGEPMKSSYWMHPSIPLHFLFDSEQEQIIVDTETIDGWVEISKSDLGMIIGELSDMPYMFPGKPDTTS